jgi:hypothetical protein
MMAAFWNKKGKAIPVTSHRGPQGCQMLRHSHFVDTGLADGRSSALWCQLLFTPRKILGTHSVIGLVDPRTGRIRSIEKSSDLIRNQICDPLACSILPQRILPFQVPF